MLAPPSPAFLAFFTRASSSVIFSTPFVSARFTLASTAGSFSSLFERLVSLYFTNFVSQNNILSLKFFLQSRGYFIDYNFVLILI